MGRLRDDCELHIIGIRHQGCRYRTKNSMIPVLQRTLAVKNYDGIHVRR